MFIVGQLCGAGSNCLIGCLAVGVFIPHICFLVLVYSFDLHFSILPSSLSLFLFIFISHFLSVNNYITATL